MIVILAYVCVCNLKAASWERKRERERELERDCPEFCGFSTFLDLFIYRLNEARLILLFWYPLKSIKDFRIIKIFRW